MFYYNPPTTNTDYRDGGQNSNDPPVKAEDNPLQCHSYGSSSSFQHGHNYNNDALYLSLQEMTDSPFINEPLFSPGQEYDSWDIKYDNNHSNGGNSDNNNFNPPQPDFLALAEQDQQAILLSDPNFVRQQQLLQEQQRVMHQRQQQEEENEDNNTTEDPLTQARSNLSAMLGQAMASGAKADHADRPNVTSQRSSLDDLSAADRSRLFYSSDHAPQHYLVPQPPLQQQQQYQQQQQSQQRIQPQQPQQQQQPQLTPKQRKEQHRRSANARISNNPRTSSPIPISTSSSSSLNANKQTTQSSSVPSEIDHQRRLTELQARFRVNYARKTNSSKASAQAPRSPSGSSSQQQQQQQQQQQVQQQQQQQQPQPQQDMPSTPQEEDKSDPFMPILRVRESKASKPKLSSSQPVSFPSRTMPIQIQRVQRNNASQPMDAEQHQRRLDDQLEKINFDDITVSELKDILRQRGKPATGKKAILVQRLQEEREMIKAARSGQSMPAYQRHSQPPPSSTDEVRPSSYQGTSPLIPHSVPQSPMLIPGSPSSMPNPSMLLPGSPNSVTLSLGRSIANMHIGSPPISSQQARRYSPYATPGSPRLGSASPKQAHKNAYSSSLPSNHGNGAMASSPGSPGSPFSSSYTSRMPRNYYSSYGANGRPKTYAPFTSSALATPDRDDDEDPFDRYAQQQQQQQQQQEEQQQQQQQQHQHMHDELTYSEDPAHIAQSDNPPVKLESMDLDPLTLDLLLQQYATMQQQQQQQQQLDQNTHNYQHLHNQSAAQDAYPSQQQGGQQQASQEFPHLDLPDGYTTDDFLTLMQQQPSLFSNNNNDLALFDSLAHHSQQQQQQQQQQQPYVQHQGKGGGGGESPWY